MNRYKKIFEEIDKQEEDDISSEEVIKEEGDADLLDLTPQEFTKVQAKLKPIKMKTQKELDTAKKSVMQSMGEKIIMKRYKELYEMALPNDAVITEFFADIPRIKKKSGHLFLEKVEAEGMEGLILMNYDTPLAIKVEQKKKVKESIQIHTDIEIPEIEYFLNKNKYSPTTTKIQGEIKHIASKENKDIKEISANDLYARFTSLFDALKDKGIARLFPEFRGKQGGHGWGY